MNHSFNWHRFSISIQIFPNSKTEIVALFRKLWWCCHASRLLPMPVRAWQQRSPFLPFLFGSCDSSDVGGGEELGATAAAAAMEVVVVEDGNAWKLSRGGGHGAEGWRGGRGRSSLPRQSAPLTPASRKAASRSGAAGNHAGDCVFFSFFCAMADWRMTSSLVRFCPSAVARKWAEWVVLAALVRCGTKEATAPWDADRAMDRRWMSLWHCVPNVKRSASVSKTA